MPRPYIPDPASGGTPDNTTDTRIPYKNVSEFDDSPLYYDSSVPKVVCDVTLEVPGGTLKVGETTDLSSSSSELIIRSQVDSQNKYIVTSEFDNTGANPPNYLNLEAEAILNVQTDFSQTLTANPLIWSLTGVITPPQTRQINYAILKTGGVMTNLRGKITDNATGVVIRYIPSKASWDSGTNGLTLVSGDNKFDFISTAADSPGVFNLGVNPFEQANGQVLNFEMQADSVNILGDISGDPYQITGFQAGKYNNVIVEDDSGNVTLDGDVTIGGDAIVNGSITSSDVTNLAVADSYISMNRGYESVVAKTGGLVVNYLPTATNDTLSSATFVAGIASTSNPTVTTVGAAVFANNDIIQINGTTNNDGIYEVSSHAANLLTIKGEGTIPTVEDFSNSQFTADTGESGTIRKITVSVSRVNASGNWETGSGAVTPIVYSGALMGTGSSVDGHIVAFDGTSGDAIKQTEDLIIRATAADSDPTITIQNNTGTPELVVSADFDTNLNAIVSQSPLVIETGGATDDLVFISGPDGDVAIRSGAAAPKVASLVLQTSTPSTVGGLTTNAAGSQFIVETPSTNDILVNSSGGNVELVVNSSTKSIRLFGATLPDTSPVVNFIQTGTNGAASGLHVGTRNPEGLVTAIGGDLYIRSDGTNSELYLKRTDTVNTGWSPMGDVRGPASTLANTFAIFTDTTGKVIDQTILYQYISAADVHSTNFQSTSASAGKSVSHRLTNILSADRSEWKYTNNTEIVEYTNFASGGVILENTASTGDLDLKVNGAAAEISVSGAALPDTTNVLRMTQSGANGGTSNIHVGTRDPNGNVTADGGALYVRDSGTNSDIYIKKSDASNTGWNGLYRPPIEVASMNRTLEFGRKDLVISSTPTTIDLWSAINENVGSSIAANPGNDQIDINTVEDAINGDLYQLDFYLNFTLDTGKTMLIEVVTNDGVSDTIVPSLRTTHITPIGTGTILQQNLSFSGVFRTPSTLTGTGAIKIRAQVSTGTATLGQIMGSLTVRRLL